MMPPEAVRKAIDSTCNTGRKLSWESKKGMLIQLVWKAESVLAGNTRGNDKVRTNWNKTASRVPVDAVATSGEAPRKKRIPPSRLRRNSRRLQAFLERKKAGMEDGVPTRKRCEISASGVTQVEGATGLAERTATPHMTLHKCTSPSKLETPASPESDSVNPDTRKSLSVLLEGASDVQYEARHDIPGVKFSRHDEDEENWIPVVVKESDGDGGEYMNGCKRVKFFMSQSGPSFSIHHGNHRFPTPACQTRSRLKDSNIS